METILALTVVAELPHDLGIDGQAVFAFEHGAPWQEWDEVSMAGLAGYPPAMAEGRRPKFRLAFERCRVRSRLPLQAADKTFGRWVMPLLPARQRLRRRVGLRLASILGLREMVTVVSITAFIPEGDLPPDPFDGWYEARIGMAIDVLNEFLVALGIQRGDPRIGPVSRSDLPPVVPLIAEKQPVEGTKREGSTWLVPLHPWVPNPVTEPLDHQELLHAATLFRGGIEGTTPWFSVLEVGHHAIRDGLAGRYGPSVVSAATCVEILLSTVVRTVGPVRGWSKERIDGALGSGLKNVLTVHVAKLLAVSVDLEDESAVWGRWWNAGYMVRNKAVHAGHRPSEAEADEATNATMHVVAEVGRLIKEDSELQHLSFGLPDSVSVGEDWIARTRQSLPTTPGR